MTNRHLEKTILEVVENQLRDNNPPETRETFQRLITNGYSPEDAKKMIGTVILSEIYTIMKTKEPFDKEKYVKALRNLR